MEIQINSIWDCWAPLPIGHSSVGNPVPCNSCVGRQGRRGISENCKRVLLYSSLCYHNSISYQQGIHQNEEVRRWLNAVSLWLKSTKSVSYDTKSMLLPPFPTHILCEFSQRSFFFFFLFSQEMSSVCDSSNNCQDEGQEATEKQASMTWQMNTLKCVCMKWCYRNTPGFTWQMSANVRKYGLYLIVQ